MHTLTLWQLLLSLSFTAHSLPDWNSGIQNSDIFTSGSVVDNGIDPFSIDLTTTEAANEIAQVSDEGNGTKFDASKSEGSGCRPETNQLPTQRRIRRGNVCPSNGLELNNGEGGRQSPPPTPKLQQNQQGQDGGGGGSGQPIPNIILPQADDPLPVIFWPEQSRPKRDPKRCYERGYLIPVCAKDSDAFIAPGSFDTYILDPCNPYFPLAACLPQERAYCCLITTVAYKQTSTELFAPFRNLLKADFGRIQRELRYHENPFKLVGVTCIPMADEGSNEIKIPDNAF